MLGLFCPSTFCCHSSCFLGKKEPGSRDTRRPCRGGQGGMLATARGISCCEVGSLHPAPACSWSLFPHTLWKPQPELQPPHTEEAGACRLLKDTGEGGDVAWGQSLTSQGWELVNAKPPQLTRAHSFTYRWHVIATSRRELAPLIFFIKMQINLIKSGIVN